MSLAKTRARPGQSSLTSATSDHRSISTSSTRTRFTTVILLALVVLTCLFTPSVGAAPASGPTQADGPDVDAQDGHGGPGGPGGPPHGGGRKMIKDIVKWQRATGYRYDSLTADALLKLVDLADEKGWDKKCRLDDVYVRKEWGTFSKKERRAYIDAVLCMQTRPSKLDPVAFPGARNRYDDFVGVHIAQTQSIHFTGNFLGWHRYYTWAYEHTLRKECGYKGYQPYMNWAIYATDPLNTPLFDGSDTSFSGDGLPEPHPSIDIFGLELPPANGGGCISNGPLKNWTVNFGPAGPTYTWLPPNPRPDGLGYNPRCIRRDISTFAGRWLKDEVITELIENYPTIGPWQDRLQGDTAHGYLGVHGGGHFLTGADPGGDLHASPGDPYFFMHHAGIDRLWWTWQNLDPKKRTYVVDGTITLQNNPPSRNATLDDDLDLSVVGLAGVLKLRDAMTTTMDGNSPFCYIYQ